MKYRFKSFATRISFYVTILSVVILSTFVYILHQSHKNAKIKSTDVYTHSILDNLALSVEKDMNIVETAVENNRWDVETRRANPDSLMTIVENIVKENKSLIGSSIAFVPNHYKSKGQYFMLYAKSVGNDSVQTMCFNDSSYDYQSMDWFTIPLKQKKQVWSEPYYDKGAGDVLMCTFSMPLFDKKGKIYAIITADLSLDEFSSKLGRIESTGDSFSFILSPKGSFITYCDKWKSCDSISFELRKCQDYKFLKQNMLQKKSGTMVVDDKGQKYLAFYTTMRDVGWSICNIYPSSMIVKDLNEMMYKIIIVLLIANVMLFVLIFYVVKRLTRPLSKFTKSVSEISQGNFTAELPEIATADEMKTLREGFSKMQKSLVDYMEELKKKTQKQERIDSELHIARSVQQGMLPKIYPPYPDRTDMELWATLRPAKEVGGDLYNYFIENDKLHFIIGDVSGKGIPASLVMAITNILFNTVSHNGRSPKQIVTMLNEAIVSENETNMFVTLLVGVLDLTTGEMRWCNAGHNPPVLMKPDESPEFIKLERNLPIGIVQGFEYKENSCRVADNTALVLYTDGITEAENEDIELYGEKRLLHLLDSLKTSTANVIAEAVINDVATHAGSTPQNDDITLLVIKYTKVSQQAQKCLILKNDRNELYKLEGFINEISSAWNICQETASKINLALEEAVANVIMYSCDGRDENEIKIQVSFDENHKLLSLEIIDHGKAFDPTLEKDVDINAKLEDREIGGLGIMLIKKIMDEMSYKRINNTNILTLKKKI